MSSPAATHDEHDGVLYDSPRTSLAWKVVVALATGVSLAWFMSFVRWFAREAPLGAVTRPMALLGAGVSVVMLVSALRSRVARRVEVSADGRALLVYRDPGVVERLALGEVTTARSEPHAGGWSRDPAGDLVVVLRDGATRRYGLPDDADTPGIARDLVTHLDALRGRS